MNIFSQELLKQIEDLILSIESESVEEKIDFTNEVKLILHKVSPLKKEPVDCVLWVKGDTILANDYNPNKVAPPEMELLKLSIMEDGYTQPIVTFQEETHREVIDGFHRNRVGKEVGMIAKRIYGYLPVVTINMDRSDKADRIASTIRHNRARGKHAIDGMTDIVVDLKRRNWSDQKIAKELGMDADEILRLAQISGLAEMFTDKEFSQAWEAVDGNVFDESENIEVINESNL
jgi:ParB-like chromosome segregation protein Spo0J